MSQGSTRPPDQARAATTAANISPAPAFMGSSWVSILPFSTVSSRSMSI